MLIPSGFFDFFIHDASLSRRVNANSQHARADIYTHVKLIKKGEC